MRHVAWLLAVGCGTQFGEEEALICGEIGRLPLGVDEPSPEGVVARDVLDAIVPYRDELEWENFGTVTGVEVSVVWTGGPVFHLTMVNIDAHRGWFGPREEGVDFCEDLVAVPVRTAVDTDDGQLAELVTTKMRIWPDGSLRSTSW